MNKLFTIILVLVMAGKSQAGSKKSSRTTACPTAINNKFTSAGSSLYSQGKVKDAIECLKLAVQQKENIHTLINLANVLTSDGQYKVADKILRRAKKYEHTSVLLLRSSATNFYYQKKYRECIKESRIWSKHHPDDIEAQLYIASSLYELKEMTDSLKEYSKALDMNENNTSALVNSAVILSTLGDHEKASELGRRATIVDPSLPEAFLNYAAAEISLKHYNNATTALQRTIDLNPNDFQARCKLINVHRMICNWSNYEEEISILHKILQEQVDNIEYMIQHTKRPCHSPGHLLHFPFDINMHKAVSTIYTASEAGPIKQMKHNTIQRQRNEQIHVGFVSYNFNNHPATHLLLKLFNLADRKVVKFYAYSLNKYTDKWRKKVEQAVDVFRDVSQTSLEATAELVLSDNIDILIDLMGFSSSGRPALFAKKPAPIQIHYLGYPGTTGSAAIDYYICDPITCDPSTADQQFTEKLIYLPAPYFIAPDTTTNPPPTTLSEFYQKYSLPQEKFIFCCLSQLGKLDQPMFHSWLEILSMAPDAVLWLVRVPPEAEHNILAETELKNKEIKNRILFTSKVSREELLSHAPQVCHLFLDTHPYNAHTVSAEMLQGGLPILTHPGTTMASRVAYSHLTSLGVEQLAANNRTHYVQLAVEFYKDKSSLSKLRSTILEAKAKQKGLFDSQNFVIKFVKALEMAWQRYEQRLAPDHIDLSNMFVKPDSHMHSEL